MTHLPDSPLPVARTRDDEGKVKGEPGVDAITQERMDGVRRHSGVLLDENAGGRRAGQEGKQEKVYPGLYETAARNPKAGLEDLIDEESGRTKPVAGAGTGKAVDGDDASGEESPNDRPGGGSPGSPLQRFGTRNM